VPRAAQQEDTVESQCQSRGQTPAVGPASNGSRASSSCLSGPRRRHIPRAFRRFLERYEGDLWRTLIDQEIPRSRQADSEWRSVEPRRTASL